MRRAPAAKANRRRRAVFLAHPPSTMVAAVEPFRSAIPRRHSELLLRDLNLFSIPAGAPFLPTLSRALLDGVLIEGFPGGADPLALARATIYVPTRRAARELSLALVAAGGGASLILPRIAPLGAFEATQDSPLFEEPAELAAETPAAVAELARRMILARMARAWGEALRGAIAKVDIDGRLLFDESEAPLVAASPAQAFALAGDLGALIDDMIIEGVALGASRRARAGRFRRLLAHHARFSQDRHCAMAGLARRERAGRQRGARGDAGEARRSRGSPPAPPTGRASSPARPAPIARPRALIGAIARRRTARWCCPISTSHSTSLHGG